MSLPRTTPPPANSKARSSMTGAGLRRTRSTDGASTSSPMSSRARKQYTGFRVMFHLTLAAVWLGIGLIWLLTPLSWLYVLWTFLTLIPSLHAGRPAPSHVVLKVLHYMTLSYCAVELPFSLYYRYLAIRANKRRKVPQASRRFLRNIIKRALENGLQNDEDGEQIISGGAELERRRSRSRSMNARSGLEAIPGLASVERALRSRSLNQVRLGDGASTPEMERPSIEFEMTPIPYGSIADLPELDKNNEPIKVEPSSATPRTANDDDDDDEVEDDEGYGASIRSGGGQHSIRPRSSSYTPSFMDKLEAEDPRAEDFRDFIRLWFNGCGEQSSSPEEVRIETLLNRPSHHVCADYKEIYRLNMADWLAWCLYSSTLKELEEERQAWVAAGKPPTHLDGELDVDQDGLELEQDKLGLLEHCLDLVEFRAGGPLREGRNPRCKVIRLTLDPVRVTQRPILLYSIVGCLQQYVGLKLRARGFVTYEDGGLRYLVRIPTGWKPTASCNEASRPLLVLHGLGCGLPQYGSMLSYFATSRQLADRPIIVLIQPHISMAFFSRDYLSPPTQKSIGVGITAIAQRWKFDVSGLTILSHSNGSIVHGWILKELPDLVIRSCFVDPVCFSLWEPWVCYNFLYSKPREPLEYLMRYFVSRELGVAFMLQRTFDWSSNLLFPSQIPRVTSPFHAAFYLAGRDAILNAERVRTYLKRSEIKEVKRGENVGPTRGGLKVHHAMKHGESMVGHGQAFDQIMSWVTAECANGGDSTACDSAY
ncbi:BQ2448_4148 [Microbotryum intermedium]|uniref:BQ2448_4148 protein n=1 Tax=Microbotryum intermedium TaxID=269621 RepID=A0A238FKE2_9BASI|nr:BQ2448_4148 [Microbotryum intermedium]